jgi:hypothetical protein
LFAGFSRVPNVARYRLRYAPAKLRLALKMLPQNLPQRPKRGSLRTSQLEASNQFIIDLARTPTGKRYSAYQYNDING